MPEVLSAKTRITILAVSLFTAIQFLPVPAILKQNERPSSARTVLFIGNSMTSVYDVPGIIEQISDDPACKGGPIRAVRYLPGGVWLQQHWERKEAAALIQLEKPAVVIIQEQSDVTLRFPEQRLSATHLFVDFVRQQKALPILYNIDIGWWTEAERDGIDSLGAQLERELSVASWHAIRVFRKIHRELPDLALFGKDNHHLSQVGAIVVATGIARLLCEAPVKTPASLPSEPHIIWELWFPRSFDLDSHQRTILDRSLD